jgi:catechol 2,3-dioxygenase-like lactoylglutathione lyase family enzyme
MRNGIAGLDHVIVAVRDLERARMGWTRLGFTLTPRGRHLGQGTANYCIMFGHDYLELLGFVERDEHAQRLEAFLKRREGPMAVAFAPEGPPEAAAEALDALGLHPSEPRALGRQLELPEGTVVPRFSLMTLPPEETPALDCFLCAHLTPELVRRPEWLAHPNGAFGVNSVHLLVEDTAPLLPAYDRLFGLHEVTTTDAVASVRAGPHRVLFSTPDDFMTMHPGIEIDPDFPLPGIAALELSVANRDDTVDYLAQWQIPFDEAPDGRLTVPAEEANGTVLFFAGG